MNSDIFWGVFENTGSIEAFLTYSKSEEISSDTYDIAGVTILEKGQKTTKKNNKSGSFSRKKQSATA